MKGLICAAMISVGAAVCQAPAFEVASVKPSLPPGAPGRATRVAGPFADAGRASWWNVPLRFYTMQAYGLTTAWRIEGGPTWFASDNFDVVGTFPSNTPKEQIPAMLKTLLTDRFKLTAHLEMKEHSIYALAVAKGGAKIKESVADDSSMTNRMGTGHMDLRKVTMQRLADLLSGDDTEHGRSPRGRYDGTEGRIRCHTRLGRRRADRQTIAVYRSVRTTRPETGSAEGSG